MMSKFVVFVVVSILVAAQVCIETKFDGRNDSLLSDLDLWLVYCLEEELS